MSKIAVGKKAPPFTLEGTGGRWSLKDAAGSTWCMYFYPRDNTPGCTQEGESFTGAYAQFKKAKTLIFGISPDTVEVAREIQEENGLSVRASERPRQEVCKLYDVIQEKSMYGKKYMGMERSTFLIDAKGVLRQEWRKVKVNGHAEAVLAAVKAL